MSNSCIDCGASISKRAVRCNSCNNKYRWAKGTFDHIHDEHSKKIKVAWERGDYESSLECRSSNMKIAWERCDFDHIHNPESVAKRSESMKEAWAAGKYDYRFACGVSKLETDFCDVLESFGVSIIRQYKPIHKGCRFVYDVLLVDYDILIEIDGDYWHYSNWAVDSGKQERDAEKDMWAINNGYAIYRFREYELLNKGHANVICDCVLPLLCL